MWANLLRFVDDDGIGISEFVERSRLSPSGARIWLTRLSKWWGYLTIDDRRVRPTAAGRMAGQIWRCLPGLIEERWETRFGKEQLTALRASLQAIATHLDPGLPDFLPILGYGLSANSHVVESDTPLQSDAPRESPSPHILALLSKVLLGLTREFENASPLSLALSANVLRVLAKESVPVAELPRMTGVSMEAVDMSVGFLARNGYAIIATGGRTGRSKVVALTLKGRQARDAYSRTLRTIETGWLLRFGDVAIRALRESLCAIIDERDGRLFVLSQGLVPPPDGWRAAKQFAAQTEAMIRDPSAALPHYPTILHRGGWPDGN
jgi:DNA-binding MarR family transcriptional regulator